MIAVILPRTWSIALTQSWVVGMITSDLILWLGERWLRWWWLWASRLGGPWPTYIYWPALGRVFSRC